MTSWRCNNCNSKVSRLSREFGTWPLEGFQRAPSDVQKKFYQGDGSMKKMRLKVSSIVTEFEKKEKYFEKGGAFLPLSVWKTQGWDTERILANSTQADIVETSQGGLCYRVEILSTGCRKVRGIEKDTKEERTLRKPKKSDALALGDTTVGATADATVDATAGATVDATADAELGAAGSGSEKSEKSEKSSGGGSESESDSDSSSSSSSSKKKKKRAKDKRKGAKSKKKKSKKSKKAKKETKKEKQDREKKRKADADKEAAKKRKADADKQKEKDKAARVAAAAMPKLQDLDAKLDNLRRSQGMHLHTCKRKYVVK